MRITKIKEISPEEVEVEWENGEVETLKGQPAKTLLQITEMKVGEEYKVFRTERPPQCKFGTVKAVSDGYVEFEYLDDSDIPIPNRIDFDCYDLQHYSFSKDVKPIIFAKKRVEQELADLEERYEKLDNFVGNARYMELPYAQKYLLVKQLAVMEEYTHILKARLDCWKD